MVGFGLWVAMVAARLEPALAGALIAATVPMRACENGEPSPLLHLERRLQPRVALGVVPLFVFLNAGVAIDAAALEQLLAPAPLGVPRARRCDQGIGLMRGAFPFKGWTSTRAQRRDASIPGIHEDVFTETSSPLHARQRTMRPITSGGSTAGRSGASAMEKRTALPTAHVPQGSCNR